MATEVTPGAAGTVANNLAALGAGRVDVLGTGRATTASATNCGGALRPRGISPDLLVDAASAPTFTYTKLLNAATGEEDLPRVDFVNTRPLPAELERELTRALRTRRPRPTT